MKKSFLALMMGLGVVMVAGSPTATYAAAPHVHYAVFYRANAQQPWKLYKSYHSKAAAEAAAQQIRDQYRYQVELRTESHGDD